MINAGEMFFDFVMFQSTEPKREILSYEEIAKRKVTHIGLFAFEIFKNAAKRGLKKEAIEAMKITQRDGNTAKVTFSEFTYTDQSGNVVMPIFHATNDMMVCVVCTEAGVRFGENQIWLEQANVPAAIFNKYAHKGYVGKMPSSLEGVIGINLDPYVTEEGILSFVVDDMAGFPNSTMGIYWMDPKTMDIKLAIEEIEKI